MPLYLHQPVVERGSWFRVDSASGSSTPITVTEVDGVTSVPNAFGGSGSTVRNRTADERAPFTSTSATVYLKRLDYKGAVAGDTPITSTGRDLTPTGTGGGAGVDVGSILNALPGTYAAKFRINVNDYGAGASKSATANTTAVQAALAAGVALGVAQREVFFPDLSYNLNLGQLVITGGGVAITGNTARNGRKSGSNTSNDGGTILVFHGNGAAFTIGSDNGHAWDAVDYDGPESVAFYNLRMQDAQDGTGATPLATVAGKNYIPGNKAIVDWRGGDILGQNLRFDFFEYGFWGIQSDVNRWTNVMAYQCRYGMWIGPRSDQNSIKDLYCYACDYPLVIDGAHGTVLYSYVQVGGGPAELRNGYSRGTRVVKFFSPWFEYTSGIDYGTGPMDHFMTIGDSQTPTYNVSDVHITEPTILMSANPNHVRYLIEVNNADVVYVEKPGGRDIRTFDSLVHVPATSMFNPRVTLDLGPNYTTWSNPPALLEGSGSPQIVRTPRYAAAIPSVGGGYGMVGDIIFKSNPSVGSPTGWVCSAAGNPGTWQEFGAVGNQVGLGSGSGQVFRISAAAGSSRILALSTAGTDRFQIRLGTTAESGSNSGSDLEISARSDTNTAVATAVTITRSNGLVKAGVGFTHALKAGAPVDGDYITTPGDGTEKVDSTNGRLYARVGGSWLYTQLGANPAPGGNPGPVDQGLYGWSFDPANASGASGSPNGGLAVARVPLVKAGSVANIAFYVAAAAVGATTGQNFGVLYDASGNQVAITADITTQLGSTGLKTIAFATPYTGALGQIVYAALFQAAATSVATIQRGPGGIPAALVAVGLPSANQRFGNVSSGLTAPPSTITPSGMSAAGGNWWFGLS